MWPYSDNELEWLAARPDRQPPHPIKIAEISPELIDYYVRRGRLLRSMAFRAMVRNLWRWMRSSARQLGRPHVPGEPAASHR